MSNKEKIAEIEEQIVSLQADVEKLKGPKEFELYLEVDSGTLSILYSDCKTAERIIGFVGSGGDCCILSNDRFVRNHAEWLKNGAKVADCEPVKWRGGEYVIDKDGNLERVDICVGRIYALKWGHTYSDCNDENIQRFEHNKRPIIF